MAPPGSIGPPSPGPAPTRSCLRARRSNGTPSSTGDTPRCRSRRRNSPTRVSPDGHGVSGSRTDAHRNGQSLVTGSSGRSSDPSGKRARGSACSRRRAPARAGRNNRRLAAAASRGAGRHEARSRRTRRTLTGGTASSRPNQTRRSSTRTRRDRPRGSSRPKAMNGHPDRRDQRGRSRRPSHGLEVASDAARLRRARV